MQLFDITILEVHFHQLNLHSFPTRRSSDLRAAADQENRRLGGSTTPARGADPDPLLQPGLLRIARVARHRRDGLEIGRATRLNSSHLVISYAVFCLKKIQECNYVVNNY